MNRLVLISVFLAISFIGNAQSNTSKNAVQFDAIGGELSGQWISDILQDRNGFIWVATQDGLFKFNGKSFKSFRYNPEKANSLQANWVRAIFQDSQGMFWLGTHGGGLIQFNEKKESFNKIIASNNTNNFNPSIVFDVFVSKSLNLWVNSGNGPYRKSYSNKSFTKIDLDVSNIKFFELNNSKELIKNNNNLYFYNPKNNELELALKNVSFGDIQIVGNHSIIYESQGKLFSFDFKNSPNPIHLPKNDSLVRISNINNNHCVLIGKNKNYYFNTTSQVIKPLSYDISNLKTIGIKKIFLDNQNLLWVGTNKGLYKQNIFSTVFKDQIDLHARRILVDSNEIIIGGGKGLFKIDKKNSVIKNLIEGVRITSICKTTNGILAGSYSGKVLYVDSNNTLSELKFNNNKPLKIYGIVEDNKNRIWISSWDGIYAFDENRTYLKKYILNNNSEAKVIKLLIDQQDNLWAITVGDGIYKVSNISKVNTANNNLTIAHYLQEDSNINSNVVMDVHLGKKGEIWIGSDYGVNRFDRATNSFLPLRVHGKLFDKKIMAIETDPQGLLWISTINDGVYVYNPIEKSIFNFRESDGLISNACLYTSNAIFNNELYFGTDEGVQIINTNNFTYPKIEKAPSLVSIVSHGENTKEIANPTESNEIVEIDHDQNNFSVDLAISDYRFPQKLNYYYKLGDASKFWTKTEGSKIDFNQINYGKHTLKVKAAYQAEDNAPLTYLALYIKPPWYYSYWAYFIYSVLFCLAIYSFFQLRYQKKMAANKLKVVEDLDAFKSNLFTNITHELRTPLTLISGPVEQQLAKKDLIKKDKDALILIKQNADRLLNLVNQMLDLAMIDSGQLALNKTLGDLGLLLKQIVSAFQYIADDKNIRIISKIKNLEHVWYDTDCVEKIVSNLLTNAVKYSPNKSEIILDASQQDKNLVLTVVNTNVAFEKKNLSQLFQRFYQEDSTTQGIGVGLSLVKELVTLTEGSIIANTLDENKIQFVITMPISRTSYYTSLNQVENTITSTIKVASNTSANDSSFSKLLVVEDDPDIRKFLHSIFQDTFQVIQAENGKTGIELALQEVPDLIISDVMMPVLNGIELCNTLKYNEVTSHIPIILLTAKVGHKSEIEGLKTGADAYITKPFNSEKLKLRVEKLIESRQALQKHYSKDFTINPALAITSTETEFLNRLQAVLNTHLTNPDFTSDYFANAMQMSRAQLHRKLTAIFGVSTSEFIRSQRLKLAIPLLKKSDATVSEIAFQVGFNSPSYFIKCFKKAYKCTPNEFTSR